MTLRHAMIAAISMVGFLQGCAGTPGGLLSAQPSGTDRPVMSYSRVMPPISPGTWDQRGQVITTGTYSHYDPRRTLPAGTTATTMIYRSVSGISGEPTVVTGVVFVPPGTPPPGGWPVIGYGHTTTGATPNCSPSQDPTLRGSLPGVAAQVDRGYAVVFTDYVGIGNVGNQPAQVHPILEPKSAAFNIIDAVRAAHAVVPHLSDRWVALGTSQGGQAAFAAAEHFADYGQGTDLLGAATITPALDLSGLSEPSALTPGQGMLFPAVVTGLAAVDPQIVPSDFLPDAQAAANRCTNAKDLQPIPIDVVPQAFKLLINRLQSYALPEQPTKIPIAVYYGSDDQIVLPEWTEAALRRACALGDNVAIVKVDGEGHAFDPGDAMHQWIADRFAGKPAAGSC